MIGEIGRDGKGAGFGLAVGAHGGFRHTPPMIASPQLPTQSRPLRGPIAGMLGGSEANAADKADPQDEPEDAGVSLEEAILKASRSTPCMPLSVAEPPQGPLPDQIQPSNRLAPMPAEGGQRKSDATERFGRYAPITWHSATFFKANICRGATVDTRVTSADTDLHVWVVRRCPQQFSSIERGCDSTS